MMGKKRYSEQSKRDAVKLITEQGYSLSKASEALGVSQTTLSTWKRTVLPGEQSDPLTEEGVQVRLGDLRGAAVPGQAPRSAELLRALFGQLKAHETPVRGKKRPAWTLKGQTTLHIVLTQTTRFTGNDYPDLQTLEFLKPLERV